MQINSLKQYHHIHFTGIKGVGMTALACIAKDFGMMVTGSDTEEYFVTDEVLAKKAIQWENGFSQERLALIRPDLVIYTAAHNGEENPEVIKAKEMGIPTLSQGEALGLFQQNKIGISVAGVGGKTTTSAMLATILESAGKHPSFMVGVGRIPSLPFCGQYDNEGEYFIAEADEYASSPTNHRAKFLYQTPKIIILTNLVYDHPDIYPNEEATLETFQEFIQRLPTDGLLIANTDSEMVRRLLLSTQVKTITYGENPQADWQIKDYRIENGRAQVVVQHHERRASFSLGVPGQFNSKNALGAFIAASQLGLTDEEICKGLEKFAGTQRRFEKIGEYNSTLLYDDYAHHPTEIEATLQTAKEWFPGKKIMIIFQPHTYSRTKALFTQFGQCFNQADSVIISDIYGSAREEPDSDISGQKLAALINGNHQAFYCQGIQQVVEYLNRQDLHDTVIVTMGAGNIFNWHDKIKQSLQKYV